MSQFLSAVLGALVAAIGGYVAIKHVTERQTKRSIAASLATSYMARFSEPDFVPLRDEVDIVLAEVRSLSPAARHERYAEICRRATPEAVRVYNRMHALAMLFAEMGVGFQRRLIDAEGLAIRAGAHIEFGYPRRQNILGSLTPLHGARTAELLVG